MGRLPSPRFLLLKGKAIPTWLMSLRLPWPRHPLLPLPKVIIMPRSGGSEERKGREIGLLLQKDQSNLGLEEQGKVEARAGRVE